MSEQGADPKPTRSSEEGAVGDREETTCVPDERDTGDGLDSLEGPSLLDDQQVRGGGGDTGMGDVGLRGLVWGLEMWKSWRNVSTHSESHSYRENFLESDMTHPRHYRM